MGRTTDSRQASVSKSSIISHNASSVDDRRAYRSLISPLL